MPGVRHSEGGSEPRNNQACLHGSRIGPAAGALGDRLGSSPVNKLVWSFLAGFLVTVIAFAVVSVIVLNGLEEPMPGWLSDTGGS